MKSDEAFMKLSNAFTLAATKGWNLCEECMRHPDEEGPLDVGQMREFWAEELQPILDLLRPEFPQVVTEINKAYGALVSVLEAWCVMVVKLAHDRRKNDMILAPERLIETVRADYNRYVEAVAGTCLAGIEIILTQRAKAPANVRIIEAHLATAFAQPRLSEEYQLEPGFKFTIKPDTVRFEARNGKLMETWWADVDWSKANAEPGEENLQVQTLAIEDLLTHDMDALLEGKG
jgi:hypothetical protein